jgi:hypothetical protein
VAQQPFRINQTAGGYPKSGLLFFGTQDSHADFVATMARFQFFDAYAQDQVLGAPTVFIRMGGTFQTTLSNGYQESQNIFGTPDAEADGIFGGLKQLIKPGSSGLEAVFKQLKFASTAATGFIQSAGLSGKSQYEFISKKFLNSFQQLIYQGPTFRRFTLPFAMKPTSYDEAEAMMDIVNTFRFASSPKGNDATTTLVDNVPDGINDLKDLSGDQLAAAQEKNDAANTASAVQAVFGDTTTLGGAAYNTVYSFGYPDTCKFTLLLQRNTGADTALSELFESEMCVIENVSVDYGSQNKMVFFSSGTTEKYYPSEVTLTINLRETSLPTTGTLIDERSTSETRTIF